MDEVTTGYIALVSVVLFHSYFGLGLEYTVTCQNIFYEAIKYRSLTQIL